MDQAHASLSLVSRDAHTRDTLEQASARLLGYLPVSGTGTEDFGDRDNTGRRLIPAVIVERLRDWIASSKSEILWIIGPAFSNTNEASLAALHIDNMAKVAKIPCISFCCTPDAQFTDSIKHNQSREMSLLIAILYTLVHRLVILADETLVNTHDLDVSISLLNGQEDSVPEALKAIKILLRHRSLLLLIILDGLDQVETDNTEPYLKELIEIIYDDVSPNSRLKVLLCSRGYVRSGNSLKAEECMDCAFLPISRPGRALPGGRFLSEMNMNSLGPSHVN